MTENMTPVESGMTDNSTPEPVLEKTATSLDGEPETQASTAESEDTCEQEISEKKEKLYANKYKSIEELEKGYKEAEKFVGKAAELEKQLTAYKEQEEKVRQAYEMQARSQGFSDMEEQKIAAEVALHEFAMFAEALEAGYAGENSRDAYEALLTYRQTGNPHDLAAVKRLFAPEALEVIAENRKAFRDVKIQEYNQNKRQTLFQTAKENLVSFVKETGDWIDPKERQDVIGLLYNEFGGDVDLQTAKAMIDTIEQGAVERYKTSLKAEQEQTTRTEQMQPPSGVSQASSQRGYADWREAQSESEMKRIVSKYL